MPQLELEGTRRRVARRTAKNDAGQQRRSSAPYDLAGVEEARDGRGVLVDQTRVGVDLESDHGVLYQGCGVEPVHAEAAAEEELLANAQRG